MNKVSLYFRESFDELLHKVSWPNWQNLQNSTVLVLVCSIIITVVIFFMDLISKQIVDLIY